MADLGVDYLYEVDFTSAFANLAPQVFVDQYMVGLHAEVVVAGFDYTYGKKETANMALLPSYAQGRFEVITVPKETLAGESQLNKNPRRFAERRNGRSQSTVRLSL